MKLKSLAAALTTAACLPAMSATLYSNDFETNAAGFSGAGSRQGTQGYGAIGYGQQFLRNDSAGRPAPASVLNLNLAAAASAAVLTLDLAIIDSWDGDKGPDIFNVKVDGDLIFSQAFSYNEPKLLPTLVTKSFGTFLGFTGWKDAAYGMTLGLGNLAAGAHTIEFFASGGDWQGGDDESWGIDNVRVTDAVTSNAPEPETYALMLAGLGVLSWVTRRRRSL